MLSWMKTNWRGGKKKGMGLFRQIVTKFNNFILDWLVRLGKGGKPKPKMKKVFTLLQSTHGIFFESIWQLLTGREQSFWNNTDIISFMFRLFTYPIRINVINFFCILVQLYQSWLFDFCWLVQQMLNVHSSIW